MQHDGDYNMYYTTDHNSPIGRLTLAADAGGEAITGAWFQGQKYFGGIAGHELIENNDFEVFEAVKSWLDRYFNGDKPSPAELPLAPCGSEFRQMVWQLLCEIPYGEVTTYGKLAAEAARRMGRERMSAQAVGGAVGHNPISIIEKYSAGETIDTVGAFVAMPVQDIIKMSVSYKLYCKWN